MTTANAAHRPCHFAGRSLEYYIGYDDGYCGREPRLPRGTNYEYDAGYDAGDADLATHKD